MSGKIQKIFTDNPFVDELIYYTKILGMGCVLKNETEALQYETVESIKSADLYMSSLEGRTMFELFTYSRELLESSSLPAWMIDSCLANPESIPIGYREEVRHLMMDYTIANYVELNEYYRKICGLPKIGETGIKISSSELPSGILIDTTAYIHDMNISEIKILNRYGVLDRLIAENPDKEYLKYLMANISIYDARRSEKFQALYLPDIGITYIEIFNKFKSKLEQNRSYTLKTIYSEAYKYGSEFYDNFIMVLIVVQTMIDVLAEVQEGIARRDVFDVRCIKYIFASYGIPYYDEIPTKFQIAMMKNINELLKFKSTSRSMVDISSLFGFSNIEIFRYFILRDRTVDEYGDYQFNYITKTVQTEYSPVTVLNQSAILPENTYSINVPFPFPKYLAKGNQLVVKINNKVIEEKEYKIVRNTLKFINHNMTTPVQVDFEFVYDVKTINNNTNPTKDLEISTRIEKVTAERDDQLTYNIPVPSKDYTQNGGNFYIVVGSTFVSSERYTVDTITNTVTFNNTEVWMKGKRDLIFVFTYSEHVVLKIKVIKITNTTTGASIFTIPEPFANYCKGGDKFFLTIGSVYIDPSRYNIVDNQLIFVGETVDTGRDIIFNFIFKEENFNGLDITTKTEEIPVTVKNQTEFTLDIPFANYLEFGNKIFIKIRSTNLVETKYDIFRDILTLKNVKSKVGDKLYVTYIYPTNKNLSISSDYTMIKKSNEDTFVIPFVFNKFLERGNKLIVSTNGIMIPESDYTINGDILKLSKPSIIVKGRSVVFTFIYDIITKCNIEVNQLSVVADEDNQSIFSIPFPFYDYMDTGNGLIVSIGSTFIDPSRYEIDGLDLIFKDGFTVAKGRSVSFVFVYHTMYTFNNRHVVKSFKSFDLNTLPANDYYIPIPFPFDDFIEQGNEFIVTIDLNVIPDIEYDILGDKLVFVDMDKMLKLGHTVIFIFLYVDNGIKKIQYEDYDKNYDLKFVKVPLLKNEDSYIKDSYYYQNYDSIVSGDVLWNGEEPADIVKSEIIRAEFNYARTKYISVDDVYELARLSFDIPYFYNMLFDDVITEELLTVPVPYLDKYKQFKLSDLFCYMFALRYEYEGIVDDIIDTTSKILYIKGFNFKADFAKLSQYLADLGITTDQMGITDFQLPSSPVLSIKALLEIFTKNKAIHHHVVEQMNNASNKAIYDIYKTIYDSLMIEKLTFDFYKKPDGTVAKSFTEYLQGRDSVLYSSLVDIKSIGDKALKQQTIIDILGEIVYEMQQFIDADEYRYLFLNIPGLSSDYIKKYIIKVIDFYKSYKVHLLDQSTIYKFDDKLQNTVRAIDGMERTSVYDKAENVYVKESMSSNMTTTLHDRYKILDRVHITYN